MLLKNIDLKKGAKKNWPTLVIILLSCLAISLLFFSFLEEENEKNLHLVELLEWQYISIDILPCPQVLQPNNFYELNFTKGNLEFYYHQDATAFLSKESSKKLLEISENIVCNIISQPINVEEIL